MLIQSPNPAENKQPEPEVIQAKVESFIDKLRSLLLKKLVPSSSSK
jgi:hypothetical protein